MDMERKFDAFVREFSEFRESYKRDQMKDAETMGMISQELRELNSAVRGNERNDQPGLIGRMRDQERRHSELELEVRNVKKDQYKIRVWALALATIASVAWNGLKELLIGR